MDYGRASGVRLIQESPHRVSKVSYNVILSNLQVFSFTSLYYPPGRELIQWRCFIQITQWGSFPNTSSVWVCESVCAQSSRLFHSLRVITANSLSTELFLPDELSSPSSQPFIIFSEAVGELIIELNSNERLRRIISTVSGPKLPPLGRSWCGLSQHTSGNSSSKKSPRMKMSFNDSYFAQYGTK